MPSDTKKPDLSKPPYRVNGYFCVECGKTTWTRDVDHGVTPFMIGCRATEGCHGTGRSMFYDVIPERRYSPPEWEWYRPTEEEAMEMDERHRGSFDHWKRGGLSLRKRAADAE